MKKILLLLFMALFVFSWQMDAQIGSYYTFSESSGTYAEITGGTVSTASGDDGQETSVPIGFTFDYVGNSYTTITLDVNGAIGFVDSDVSYSNDLASTTANKRDIVAPLWDDLYARASDSPEIMYKTEGTTPNQKFTVQWKNLSWRNAGKTVSFQVVLHENGQIDFNYGVNNSDESRSASIGINESPGGSGNFISVTPGSPATTSSSSANNSISTSSYPGDGHIYTFTPVSCHVPTSLMASAVTTTSASLSWITGGASAWEVVVQDAGAGTPMGAGTAAANPYNVASLLSSHEYEFYVRDNCGMGDFSDWAGPQTFTTLPSNDACAMANPTLTVYADGACPGNEISTSTSSATDSGAHPSCDNVGTNLDLWYQFVAPATGGVEILTSSSSLEAAVWDGCGGSEIACKSPANNKLVGGLTSGTTYYLQVWHDSGSEGAFDLCLEKATAPDCAANPTDNHDASCGNYSFDLSWDAVSTAAGYKITVGTTSGGVDIENATDLGTLTSYTLSSPSVGTTYYWTVVPYNAIGDATGCTENTVTTVATGCYCSASGNISYNTGVNKVQLHELVNNDAINDDNAYEDFTAMTATLGAGKNYDLYVDVDSDGPYDVAAKAWIDWNGDFDFDDAGEEYDLGIANSQSPGPAQNYPVSITTPVTPGTYRMRVAARYNSYPTSCGTGYDGEVEDYTITVVSALSNDDCAGAIDISDQATYNFDTNAGSDSGINGCAINPDDDLWYKLTTNATGSELILTVTGADFELFDGSCGILASIGCNITTYAGTPNTTYYIRVYDPALGFGKGGSGDEKAMGTIKASGSLLPIQLARFNGEAMAKMNLLEWVTSAEKNVAYFAVERSINGESRWLEVGKVSAVGNSVNEQYYSLEDEAPLALSYYRLKTVDNDGAVYYSKVISITQKVNIGDIRVYPIPASKDLTVQFVNDTKEEVEISLVDINGRIVYAAKESAFIGSNRIVLDVNNIPSGVYSLIVATQRSQKVEKVVLQK